MPPLPDLSQATGLRKIPIPSSSTSTTSPDFIFFVFPGVIAIKLLIHRGVTRLRYEASSLRPVE